MMTLLVVGLSVGALCAGWALVQTVVTRVDPELRGPERSSGGCCGACGDKTCDKVDA
jgi:hypothetical protein